MRTLAESTKLINTYLPEAKFEPLEEEYANLLANAIVGTIVQMGSGLYPFKGGRGNAIWERAKEQADYWNSLDKPRPIKEQHQSSDENSTPQHKHCNTGSKIYRAVQMYNESTDKTKSVLVDRYVTELGLPHRSAMTYYHLAKSGRY